MRVLAFISCLVFALFLRAEPGTVVEGRAIQSAVLNKAVRYSVYLPAGYATSQRSYPLVYLLHGYTDDETAWVQFGDMARLMDAAIASGEIAPMVVVMPDGGTSWYINNHDGKVRWEDHFIRELIPHVEATYRLRPGRAYRALAGLSMGGFGTLVHTLRHPDLFGSAAALSPAVYTEKQILDFPEPRWREIEAIVYGPDLAGAKRLTQHLKQYHPLHLISQLPASTLKSLQIYLDCGDDDDLIQGTVAVQAALRAQGAPCELRIRDGGHVWDYWRTGLIPALAFISRSFRN